MKSLLRLYVTGFSDNGIKQSFYFSIALL